VKAHPDKSTSCPHQPFHTVGLDNDRGAIVLRQKWSRGQAAWLHHNVLAVALANKLARIALSALARGRVFEMSKVQPA
jgi:hypothetical protein